MFEAVGEHYWPQYFATVAERLKQGGRAVIQTITIRDDLFDGYRSRSDFIRHYVFPGRHAAVAGALPRGGRAGRTEIRRAPSPSARITRAPCATGRTACRRRSTEITALGHDQQFLRNWQFYLGICAASFNVARTDVVQVELVNA